jgi:hypothetical protein
VKPPINGLGDLTSRFGDMVEPMALPNLVAKFEELGFTFTKANRTGIKDKQRHIYLEKGIPYKRAV